jgi:hypothetical protein
MKQPSTIFAIVIAIALTPALPRLCQAQNNPAGHNAKKTAFEHNFGIADADAVIRHSFEVHNDGPVALTLGEEKLSCGSCMRVDSKTKTIDPGQKGTVVIVLDTKGKQGVVTQYAAIKTNNDQSPYLVFSLRGVIRGVWSSPPLLDLGNIRLGEPATTRTVVIAAGHPDARISGVQSTSPLLDVSLKPATISETQKLQGLLGIGLIEVQWKGAAASPGRLNATLLVKTTIPAAQTLQIPVSAFVVGDLETLPSRIVFGRVAAGRQIRRTCKLSARVRQTPIDLRGITFTAEHPAVTCQIKSANAGSAEPALDIELLLDAPKVTNTTRIEGAIVGKQNGNVVVEIPYFAVVQPAASSATTASLLPAPQ